jgi:hypothetical protein
MGESNGHYKFERSFYFTISDGPLSYFDDVAPDCGQADVCADRKNCAGLLWRNGIL